MKRFVQDSARAWFTLIGLAIVFALVGSGCATPIGVNYVDRSVAYHSLTANALSSESPSSFSARELMNLNLYQRFGEEPEKTLADLHAGLASPTGRFTSIPIVQFVSRLVWRDFLFRSSTSYCGTVAPSQRTFL